MRVARANKFAWNERCWNEVLLTPPNIVRSLSMKTLISTFALALALAFTGPAFAGDVTTAKNQADCEKAGGMWDAQALKCSAKPQ